LRGRIQNAPKRDGEKERRRSKEWEKASRERERERERLGEKNVQVPLSHYYTTEATEAPAQPHNPCFSSANQQPVTPSATLNILQLTPSHNPYHQPKGRNRLTQPCVSLV